jgi:hypothetical protein
MTQYATPKPQIVRFTSQTCIGYSEDFSESFFVCMAICQGSPYAQTVFMTVQNERNKSSMGWVRPHVARPIGL